MHWILAFFLLTSCSGYRFTQQENPLSQYGIQTLSVPMFYNFSNQADVSAEFTREMYRLLTNFKGLKIRSGYTKSSDAVLIGIIRTPEKMIDTVKPNNERVAKEKAPESVGGLRQTFYIPGTTDVEMILQVVVIKKPTEEELALLQSGIGSQVKPNSKIIFNELIPIRGRYTREILDEQGTQVIATQNAGVQRKTIRTMAEQAAISVRDLILYAF